MTPEAAAARPRAGQPATMTIDELARRAGCTTRNVRNYQTARLLPPPEIVGRVAHYGEGHLARLRLIASLQSQGFSLAGIGQLLRAWEEGHSLGDLLGFERVLTEPWTDDEPQRVTPEQLLSLFPESRYDPSAAQRSLQLGLIVPQDDGTILVPQPRLLRIGAELVAAGIPLAAVHEDLAALRDDLDRVARRFVALFEDHIWKPFAAAGMPADRLPAITETLRRLRPLAEESVRAVLAQAMQRHVARSTAANVPSPPGPAAAAAGSAPDPQEVPA